MRAELADVLDPERLYYEITEVRQPGFTRDEARFYVARRNGTPVGALHLATGDGARCALVEHIYVVPDARRRGVATALLEHGVRETGLQLAHDNRASDAGVALTRSRLIRPLPGFTRERLDDAVVEETGAKLLASLTDGGTAPSE